VPSAIWSGSIGFGLVNVPVKVVTATKSQDVRFNQLEEETGARIRYKRVSEATGEEVPNERIVKGYSLSGGNYVVVDDDEMKALAPKASRTVQIEDFVDLDHIDPVFFEHPYYLVPDKAAVRPYKLLVQAMTELNRVAIGRVVMRSKESLVAIRPVDGVLVMETMRYADEVLPPTGVMPDEEVAAPSDRELEMAKQLVDSLSSDFEPTKYHDEYREQLMELIEKKAAGEQIVAQPVIEDTGKVLDLMAALEASLSRPRGPEEGDEDLPPAAESDEGEKPKRRGRGRKSA
jgi:DNA end-binding protein Ku